MGSDSLYGIVDQLGTDAPQAIRKQVACFAPVILVDQVQPKQIPGLVGQCSVSIGSEAEKTITPGTIRQTDRRQRKPGPDR